VGRFSVVLALVCAVLVTGATTSGWAAEDYDALTELREASYITIRDMQAVLPHGSLMINSGVVASFTGVEQRTAGVVIGDIELLIDNLPQGGDVLNLFAEIDPNQRVVRRQSHQAFYSVAMSAASKVTSGYPVAIRSWYELDDDEQEEFTSVYLQAYSDGWIEGDSRGSHGDSHWDGGGHPGGGGATAVRPRFPVGNETFAAVWTDDGTRWDYRINAAGDEVSITDYYRNIVFVQQPWAPEEGELDPVVDFTSIDYGYAFFPHGVDQDPAAPGKLSVSITANFTVSEPRTELQLVSYPWLTITEIEDDLVRPVEFTRGGPGLSDWILRVSGDYQPGEEYELRIGAECTVPETYGGVGYGGVYRFDTAALWPGEDTATDIRMDLAVDKNGWTILASGGAEIDVLNMGGPEGGYGPYRDETTASWPANTRNQMLVATMFPSRTIATDWGELQVFAPPELIDGVEQMESINALGEIISYYNGLWGGRGVTSQPVFLVPDEHGVQAFEDAGLIFILGGDRTGIPLIAHETAHLWWGYDVGSPRWFYEGMANYGAAKFVEHYYGDTGPLAGANDPLSYRRYLMNFSLGYELPLSFDRRDKLDDTAAVYHNSAAFLLTMDAIRPYGIDGILRLIHEAGNGAEAIGSEELRGIFADQSGGELGEVWDSYAVRGEIPVATADDPTYRRFEWTPERENYVAMLRWLVPSMKKEMQGDIAGALYCAYQAQEYRNEPKDRLRIAGLLIKSGELDLAWEMAAAQLENPETDDKTRVSVHWTLSKIYRAQGDKANEHAALDYVIANGPAVDMLYVVQQAQARLAELDGTAVDAESGATPSGGYPGG